MESEYNHLITGKRRDIFILIGEIMGRVQIVMKRLALPQELWREDDVLHREEGTHALRDQILVSVSPS